MYSIFQKNQTKENQVSFHPHQKVIPTLLKSVSFFTENPLLNFNPQFQFYKLQTFPSRKSFMKSFQSQTLDHKFNCKSSFSLQKTLVSKNTLKPKPNLTMQQNFHPKHKLFHKANSTLNKM